MKNPPVCNDPNLVLLSTNKTGRVLHDLSTDLVALVPHTILRRHDTRKCITSNGVPHFLYLSSNRTIVSRFTLYRQLTYSSLTQQSWLYRIEQEQYNNLVRFHIRHDDACRHNPFNRTILIKNQAIVDLERTGVFVIYNKPKSFFLMTNQVHRALNLHAFHRLRLQGSRPPAGEGVSPDDPR